MLLQDDAGFSVGNLVGAPEGFAETVGVSVGLFVGDLEGAVVVGDIVGLFVGDLEGSKVGFLLGCAVGEFVVGKSNGS